VCSKSGDSELQLFLEILNVFLKTLQADPVILILEFQIKSFPAYSDTLNVLLSKSSTLKEEADIVVSTRKLLDLENYFH
jgi:hypothetical protein